MDVDQNRRLSDQEVIELLEKELNGKRLTELSVRERKQVLKEIKQNPNVSNRQLARVAGVGLNIIRRL
ncbi:hypothetical protein [uncultured Sanguibacteroides sp.]|uniref:hypothetical protein n=1 Tax=uncultured Sanguibacteroides sp. TaxID=1635151 RepID=UPI0025D66F8B|nr:hypothetical protein [uncultured Sanguibacteroides sp.]